MRNVVKIYSTDVQQNTIVACTLVSLTDKSKRRNTQNVIRGYPLYFRQLYVSCLSIATTANIFAHLKQIYACQSDIFIFKLYYAFEQKYASISDYT